jgi:hypothetical protein
MVAQGGGDAGFPGQAQDGDGQVAQAGHHAGAVAGADLGAVLVVGDVADLLWGSDGHKWDITTNHPGRAMINYSPSPREMLHMWRVRAGQAADQQR